MTAFFPTGPGRVKRLDLQGQASPMSLQMQNVAVGGANRPDTRAIVTGARLQLGANVETSHSLNETIYLYVFGDRAGQLEVSGLAFAENCDASDSAADGLSQVLDAYGQRRVSRTGAPVLVNIGRLTFRTFLLSTTVVMDDPERVVAKWSYQFLSTPRPQ